MPKTIILLNPMGQDITWAVPTLLRGTIMQAGDTIYTLPYDNTSGIDNITGTGGGVDLLDAKLNATSGTILVLGYSEGDQIADAWLTIHGPTSTALASRVSFLLLANADRKYGGFVHGHSVFDAVAWTGGKPDDTPFTVVDFARQYDGVADFPTDPDIQDTLDSLESVGTGATALNDAMQQLSTLLTDHNHFLAVENTIAGIAIIHTWYFQVAVNDETNLALTEGNITYVWSPTYPVPLLGNGGTFPQSDKDDRIPIETAYDRPVDIPLPNYAGAPSGWWGGVPPIAVPAPPVPGWFVETQAAADINMFEGGVDSDESSGTEQAALILFFNEPGVPAPEQVGGESFSLLNAITDSPVDSGELVGTDALTAGAVSFTEGSAANDDSVGSESAAIGAAFMAEAAADSLESVGGESASVAMFDAAAGSAEESGTEVAVPGAMAVAEGGVDSAESVGTETMFITQSMVEGGADSTESVGTETNMAPMAEGAADSGESSGTEGFTQYMSEPSADSAETLPTDSVYFSNLVTREPYSGNLLQLGQRFRFSGWNAVQDMGLVSGGADNGNAYGGVRNGGGGDFSYLPTHVQINEVLNTAVLMHAQVMRSFIVLTVNQVDAIQPTLNTYSAKAFEQVDYVLFQCAIRGLKIVLPLIDSASAGSKNWYCQQNGVSQDDPTFYTNTTVINSFKSFISTALNHVNQYTGLKWKDSPEILAWETGNELTTTGSASDFNAWTDTISTHIKVTESAKQLVLDGRYGLTGDWVTFDTVALALPNVDGYSNHAYDQYRTVANMQLEGQMCHKYGKFFCIGERTWTDRDYTGALNAPALTVMNPGIEVGAYIDGDIPWELLAQLTIWYGGFSMYRPATGNNRIPNPNFPFTPFFMDPTDMDSRGTLLIAHCDAMALSRTVVDVGTTSAETGGTESFTNNPAYNEGGADSQEGCGTETFAVTMTEGGADSGEVSGTEVLGIPSTTNYPSTTLYPSTILYPTT